MTGVSLLAYADRLAGDLAGLDRMLRTELPEFTGVHILPFFTPFDGDDAGFDPVDHFRVDPRLGTWADVRTIAGHESVTADLIVNHVSTASAPFVDWLEHGPASTAHGMFLTFDRVFPAGASEADITAVYRPRPGLPFTPFAGADGRRHLVWTTFLPSQVDIDVRDPAGLAYLERLADTIAAGGVSTVRLDAVGYAVKTAGTNCFMTPDTLAFVAECTAMLRARGLRVLVEVHAHYELQLQIAQIVDLVYDFALAPLLLHAFGTGSLDPLARWLQIRPANAVTVLDTHDGIGIVDAGPQDGREGLLTVPEMADIFARASAATGGHSDIASVRPAWAPMPHQVNATFFSVLGGDPRRLLTARAVQVFLPGEPQFYYVGLLGGLDDRELFARTGQGRDVNRHHYLPQEVRQALRSPVARAQLRLAALRRHPAFDGEATTAVRDGTVEISWRNGDHEARLRATFAPDAGAAITVDGEAFDLGV